MGENSLIRLLEEETPVFIIRKKNTQFEPDCDKNDFITNTILSGIGADGHATNIYTGICRFILVDESQTSNLHLDFPDSNRDCSEDITTQTVVDDNDISINEIPIDDIPINELPIDNIPIVIDGVDDDFSQSQVWIDPVRSPYLYNQCDNAIPECSYTNYHQTHNNHITLEQHNTYITHNVYNYENADSHCTDINQIKMNRMQVNEMQQNMESNNYHTFEDEQLEDDILSEEVINKHEMRKRDEYNNRQYIDNNNALKQLMSPQMQPKQQKTIMFLGQHSQNGHTVQKITVNDPQLECTWVDERKTKYGMDKPLRATQKIYQCDKCKQIFNQLTAFKYHMVNHKGRATRHTHLDKCLSTEFVCIECGKKLKTKEKHELHCMGHGDPNLECDRCHNVFASKFTLRTHRKIHFRKYRCSHCPKSYYKFIDVRTHIAKKHFIFMCELCDYVTHLQSDLKTHVKICDGTYSSNNELESTESFLCDSSNKYFTSTITNSGTEVETERTSISDVLESPDSVIAKVISTRIFEMSTNKSKRERGKNKVCVVCRKAFDRSGDLKRHLIEHVIKKTLEKTPVNKDGVLNIVCEVCRLEAFNKVDIYKAHLREHAGLTLYKCTVCNKSFSDSSNFSKHKKVHGASFLQCDLCQRKFNSKKMLIQHLDYHKNNSPIACQYCNNVYHFESTLKKHVKNAHEKEVSKKFKCKFCLKYFKALKEKWDHEWMIHNMRRVIADCWMCGAKYRKYSELKKHCSTVHSIEIPPAKSLPSKRRRLGH